MTWNTKMKRRYQGHAKIQKANDTATYSVNTIDCYVNNFCVRYILTGYST